MWFSRPVNPAKTGSTNSARKASIFPPRPMVTSGRAMITATNTTVNASNTSTIAVGMETSLRYFSHGLFQRMDVLNQGFDLAVRKFFVVSLHFSFALVGDVDQLGV